jgi:ribonuclease P protein subunit RPR2
MKRRRRIEDLAEQRIERLFELAEVAAKDGREQRSQRYIELARAIGMRYRVRIPKHLKMRLCKRCYALLIPGKTARVRLRSEYMTTTCLRCGEQMRRPYKTPRAPSVRREVGEPGK